MAEDELLAFKPAEPSEIRFGTALSEEGRASVRPTMRGRGPGPTQGRLGRLCDALTLALELPFVPHAVPSYTDLLAGLHWGDIQLAWLPPMIALRAVMRDSAKPIAAPVRAGSAWYWAALFTHPDSTFSQISELEHARVAWVDHMSSAGYLVVRASLRADGLELSEIFGDEQFLGSHDDVVRAVLERRVDAGATFAHFDDAGRVRNAGWGKNAVKILKFAGPIPSDVLSASTHLPAHVVEEIGETLTGEGHSEVKRAAADLMGATGFVSVTREHLAHLEDLLAYVEMPMSFKP